MEFNLRTREEIEEYSDRAYAKWQDRLIDVEAAQWDVDRPHCDSAVSLFQAEYWYGVHKTLEWVLHGKEKKELDSEGHQE